MTRRKKPELNQQDNENRLGNQSDEGMFYGQIPRIILAEKRDAFDVAFWVAVRDIAGNNGTCYVSTKHLALWAGMSEGKAADCRDYWIAKGFLVGELRTNSKGNQYWDLVIPKLWMKNKDWWTK